MPCVIKDGNKFYEKLFLGYELYAKKTQPKSCIKKYRLKINTCSMATNKMVELVLARKGEKKERNQFLLRKLRRAKQRF